MEKQVLQTAAVIGREFSQLTEHRVRELHEAHRLFTEMGATGDAERLAKELGL
jgi:hypothetical protein